MIYNDPETHKSSAYMIDPTIFIGQITCQSQHVLSTLGLAFPQSIAIILTLQSTTSVSFIYLIATVEMFVHFPVNCPSLFQENSRQDGVLHFLFKNRKLRKKLPAPPKEIKHVPTPVSTAKTMDEDAYKSASRSSFHLLATGALHML